MRKATSHSAAVFKPSSSTPHAGPKLDDVKRRLQLRDRWFRCIPPENHFSQLLDELPDVYLFAKDNHGRIMYLNRAACERCGLTDDTDLIGLTDVQLIPAFLKTEDDRQILASGVPIRDRLDLWFDANAIPDWYVTTKLPIRSRRGRIIGLMGISTHYRRVSKYSASSDALMLVVDYIRQNYFKRLTVSMLAEIVHLSPRQLERQFRSILNVTPKQFLIRTRLSVVRHALRQTQASLADIAAHCGFYDQSALTQHFHQFMGVTPSQFRRNQDSRLS